MKLLFKVLIALVLVTALTPSVNAAWKNINGAELNSVTDGVEITTNSAPAATTSAATHSGTYAWRVTAGAGFFRQVVYTTGQTATGTVRIWVYPVARPNANTQMLRFSSTANATQGHIVMTTTGTLVLQQAGTTQIGSASAALPLNAWSCVELMDEPTTGANGTLTARLDGVTFATGANSAAGSWARVLWGNVTGVQTTNDTYFDDLAVVDASTGFPGCGSTVFMQPNAAGDSNAWLDTAAGAGSTNNYTLVNERPPNDVTTMVQSNLLNSEDLYNFTDSGLQSYDTINAVVVGTRHRNDTADTLAAYQIEWEAASGGTKATSVSLVPNTTTWTSYSTATATGDHYKFSTTTTTTGAALTAAILDSMQAGYISSVLNLNKIQITNIWSYADYTAGTPPPATADNTIIYVSDE